MKKDYPRYGEIINKKNPTPIILVGCNTDNIAKDLSKMHKFLTVVGSNGFCKGKLTEHKTSAYIEGVSTNPEINLNDRGWKFYKNGKLVMYEPSKYFSDINIFR